MSNQPLLSRYADALFWLARYIERAENLARILDVNETFSRDSQGGQNWHSIVLLNTDEERFFEMHDEPRADAVLEFYVTDAENPTSILSAIREARDNARTLRPLISTEMWTQLNMFYNSLKELKPTALASGNRARLFGTIKEACQTHTGITEGTFYRDQGWYFYQLGRAIERADQTTRLLDIKYHLLLPRPTDVGRPVDVSQWNALLRSVAGYHAFRRLHSDTITPGRVAGFLLRNPSFPRSVAFCLRQAGNTLTELKSRYFLRSGNDGAELLDELRVLIESRSTAAILSSGLHEFLDMLQAQLNSVSLSLGQAFFGYEQTGNAPEPAMH